MGEVVKHLGYIVALVLAAAGLGVKHRVALLAWLDRHYWLRGIGGLLTLLCLAVPLQGQATRDSVVCSKCIDSLVVPHTDSAIVRVDTIYRIFSWADTLRRDSLIQVPIPPDTTHPPVLVGACQNEPRQWTLVTVRPFRPLSGPLLPSGTGVVKDSGWASAGAFSMVSDRTAPDGDGWVGQEFYRVGAPAGSATMASWPLTDLKGRGFGSLYLCYAMWVDPNYSGNQAGVGKQGWMRTAGTAAHHGNRLIVDVHGAFMNKLRAAVSVQGLPNANSIINYPAGSTCDVSRGQWHWWEIRADRDGTLSWWLDGKLCGLRGGFLWWWPGEKQEWSVANLNNTYGGSGAANPVAAYIRIDHMVVRGAP